MRLAHQIGSILFLFLGLLALQQAFTLEYTSPGTGAGPGFLPLWTSACIVLVAVGMFISSTQTEPAELPPGTIPDRTAAVRLGLAVASLFAVVFLIVPLGFRLTMAAFFLWILLVVGRWDWWKSILFAVAASYFLYWLFNNELMVPLPRGTFGF